MSALRRMCRPGIGRAIGEQARDFWRDGQTVAAAMPMTPATAVSRHRQSGAAQKQRYDHCDGRPNERNRWPGGIGQLIDRGLRRQPAAIPAEQGIAPKRVRVAPGGIPDDERQDGDDRLNSVLMKS